VLYADKVKPNKWHTPYYGPLKIVEQIDGDGFIICELADESIKQTVHISRLKPFFYDERYVDVLAERLKDRREQKIEQILSHRGRIAIKGNNNNSVEFQVLWGDGLTTWTPYGKLKKLKILKDYLVDQKDLRGLTKRKIATNEINMITVNTNLIKVLEIKAEECMRPHQLDQLIEGVLKWNYPANPLEDGVNSEDIDIAINKSNIHDVFIGGNVQEKEQISLLLQKYSDVFGKLDTNGMQIPAMNLNLKEEELHTRAIHMFQPSIVGEALTHLTEMINEFEELGIIERAKPDKNGDFWSSRINLINETVNDKIKYRFTLDYSALNTRLQDYYFNMPSIPSMVEKIARYKFMGKFDMRKYYFQIPIHEDSRAYTAFTLPDGRRFQWTRCPMGVAKSAGYAQEISKKLFGDDAFLDDVMIKGESFDDFLTDLEFKLSQARKYNLKISGDKTILNTKELEFLGRKIGDKEYWLSDDTRSNIAQWKRPENVNELLQFLGLCNYCRDFIQDFAIIAAPLYDLHTTTPGMNKKKLNKKRILTWTDEAIIAFEVIKQKIIDSESLSVLDYSKDIFINTDASNLGYGAILYQLDNNGNKVICKLISGKFNKTQAQWPTIEQESYAIFMAITKWRYCLQGVHFNVLTDHKNITYILKHESKKILRWKLALMEFTFDVFHIAGTANSEADILSRLYTKS
jgi:hypothetical protein